MEQEKLKWVEEHKDEIRYFNQNKNNSELIVKYRDEIKKVSSLIAVLKDEFKEKRDSFKSYLETNEDYLTNQSISKSYDHIDKNAIEYMCVYELKKYQMKIDVNIGLTGWSINLRTLERITDPMLVKNRLIAILTNNKIDIIEKTKNPYVDEFHINVFEFDSDEPVENVVDSFIKMLKIFI